MAARSFFECPICFSPYQSPGVKTAKNLPCGHSFCQECIDKQASGGKLECSSCRKKFKFPKGGAANLMTNFAISDGGGAADGSISSKRLKLDDGKGGSNARISSFKQCSKNGHCNKNLEYFCKTHGVVVCGSCIVLDHRLCDCAPLSVVAEEARASFDEGNINAIHATLKESLQKNIDIRSEIRAKATSEKVKLDVDVKKVKDALDAMQHKLHSQIDDAAELAISCMIDPLIDFSKAEVENIVPLLADIDQMKMQNDAEFMELKDTFAPRIKEMEAVTSVKQTCKLPTIDVCFDATKAIASVEACITRPMVSGVVPSVVLSGFYDIHESKNGVYLPTGALQNGKPVYSKGVNCFLHYSIAGFWMVSSKANMEANNEMGWIASSSNGDRHPTAVAKWQQNTASDPIWENNESSTCTLNSARDISVSFRLQP